MGRRSVYKTEQVVALAQRSEGVSSRELQDLLGCEPNTANSLLVRATRLHGLVRTRGDAGKFLYFSTAQHCAAFRAATQAARQARAEQAEQARQRAAKAKAARTRESAASRAADRKPGSGRILPPKAKGKPKAYAANACAVVPTDVKRTVYERTPVATRVDVMADPLPGVPGWPGGPVIRPGALEYKRHMSVRGDA